MALVTVTYNAWDHNREVVPAELHPRVGFRPVGTSLAAGLMTSREVWGSLNPTTGAGAVEIESSPGLVYVPFMDWLVDRTQEAETVENRARAYCEWKPVFPGVGGPIETLDPAVGFRGILYGFGSPPLFLENVVYLNITGPTIRIYGPAGALVEG